MKRQMHLNLLILIVMLQMGCGSDDTDAMQSPYDAPSIQQIEQLQGSLGMIPFTIIESSKVVQFKMSFDVQVDLVW